MNVQHLITAVVRQTTVLVAQLATSGGARAPLAHVANQVFLDLARELEGQGVGRKVSADMFGMALRSYQRKLQRLNESSTDEGKSLWQAVLDFLTERKHAPGESAFVGARNEVRMSMRGPICRVMLSRITRWAARAATGWPSACRVALPPFDVQRNEVRWDDFAAASLCQGVELGRKDTGTAIQFARIQQNRVIGSGEVGISVDATEQILLESNVVISGPSGGFRHGILIPARTAVDGEAPIESVTVLNSTVWQLGDAQSKGISIGSFDGPIVLASNLVVTESTVSAACFEFQLAAEPLILSDYNWCDVIEQDAIGEWAFASPQGTLEDWQLTHAQDLNSGTGPAQASSPVAPSYAMSPSSADSPLVDAGHPTLSAEYDIASEERDALPDIGAYEWK